MKANIPYSVAFNAFCGNQDKSEDYIQYLCANNVPEHIVKALVKYRFTGRLTANEIENLPNLIKEANEKIKAYAEKNAKLLEENGFTNAPSKLFLATKPLPLFPKLTKKETAQKLKDLDDERRTRAETVISYIPAIAQIIDVIKKMNREAAETLIEAGEDFLKTADSAIAEWSTAYIKQLIEKERYLRYEEKFDQKYNGPEATPESLRARRKEEQKRIRIEIRKRTKDIEKTLNQFFQSNYFKASEKIKNEITYFDTPKNGFSIYELSLLFFFAYHQKSPDQENTLSEEDYKNIDIIFSCINDYFTKYSKNNTFKGEYETFISFACHFILGASPDAENIQCTTPDNPYITLLEPYRSIPTATPANTEEMNISQSGRMITLEANGSMTIIPSETAERAMLAIYAFVASAKEKGYSQNGLYTVSISKLLNMFMPTEQYNKSSETPEEKATKRHEKINMIIQYLGKLGIITDSGIISIFQWVFIGEDYINFRSEWAEMRYKLIDDNAKIAYGKKMNTYLRMIPNSIIKAPVYVRELTAAILTEMIMFSSHQKAAIIKYPVCPEYLIKTHCREKLYPALRAEKEGREITRILRRAFDGFYKIFNTPKCRNYFLPPKIIDESGNEKEIPIYFELVEQNGQTKKGLPHPTSKNWQTSKFIIYYGGIKPRSNT